MKKFQIFKNFGQTKRQINSILRDQFYINLVKIKNNKQIYINFKKEQFYVKDKL